MVSPVRARRYEPEELLSLRKDLHLGIMALQKLGNLADIMSKTQESSRRPNYSSEYGSIRSSYSYSMWEPRSLQWHLRDRGSSESEPLSAPTGIAAQQSENFQRFYRAVVSPTHVRVTAGGKIVPNNRAVAPPIFDWKNERFIIDPPKSDLQDLNQDQLASVQPTLLPQAAPRQLKLHGQHSQSSSLVPGTMHGNLQGSTNGSEQTMDLGGHAKVSKEVDSEPIKISHPSQFDNSRPFMYNGHVVYPLPSGYQPPPSNLPVPITLLGNPNFLAQHQHPLPSNYFPPPLPIGPMMHHPLMLPSANHHPALYQIENNPPIAPPYTPAPAPAPAILSVSELTKHQIEGFRTHLKYLDNQIANNRHQIDVLYMEHQRREVISAIDNMETMLETQLTQERVSSAVLHHSQTFATHRGDMSALLPRKEQSQDSSSHSQPLFVKPQSIRVHISSPPVAVTKPVIMAEAIKAAEVKLADTPRILKLPTRSEPASKSKLSATAAMAPAFQPRAQTATKTASSTTTQATTASYFTPPTADWIYSTPMGALNGAYLPNIPPAQSMYENHSQNVGLPTNYQRPQTFHGLAPALTTHPYIAPNSIPYLIGTLPKGMTADEATQKDLVYGRELTEAELRARHLYWGKAPRSVFTGLPKYDGKDFYPPSPLKSAARLVSNPYDIKPTVPRTSSPEAVDLESLFEDSSNVAVKRPSPIRVRRGLESILTTPIRASHDVEILTTPVRSKPNLETAGATPNQLFLENGIIGFQSPSPRPSKYKYEFTSPSNWPVSQTVSAEEPSFNPNGSPSVIDSLASHTDDFSHLFLRRGEPGFMSPTPLRPGKGNRFVSHFTDEEPVTPTNRLRFGRADGSDTGSKGSTGELSLSPKTATTQSPKIVTGNSFIERSSSSYGGEHNLLQNMLKHTAPTISAPVLSATTAQGYLPLYRGFAAASLSQPSYSMTEAAPLIAANFLPENRPLNRDRPRKPVRASPETLGEVGYQNYLIAKAAEDAKTTAAGWNANTSASGPVTGSDW